ncbi:hypothetical protein [Actinomadura montaniterrae]|uniref:Uncharacterized protein n=1 Tax=Actinomadura montaniterrae TaxID=1803903 RepID=A0A6L3W1N3_9ACTN|nr:hypothetical protein [Actinomadura montaniterrae]KAB2383630.1 hypothetical protein F9B16_11915 [Actinomadura montaniterrae]
MTYPVDDLVASLNPVRDGDITTSDETARALLTAITTETPPTPAPRLRFRPRLRLRFAVAAAVAVAAAAALIILPARDAGPLRSYANAAVRIDVTGDDEYEVEVKDAYADQREFREAFARFGLDVRLRIVPVSPGEERRIIRVGSLHAPSGDLPPGGVTGTSDTDLKCPADQGTCPLRVKLGGAMFHLEGADVVLGRRARPGELYQDATPEPGDRPKSLRLTGRTVGQALVDLDRRGLTWAFSLGAFKPDGSGSSWNAPANWRPAGDRRITGAWMRSSDSVGLLVTPEPGDPAPDPNN